MYTVVVVNTVDGGMSDTRAKSTDTDKGYSYSVVVGSIAVCRLLECRLVECVHTVSRPAAVGRVQTGSAVVAYRLVAAGI